MSGMNWDRVHAEDKRRRTRPAPTTTFGRRHRKNPTAARFKVDYGLECDHCHQAIRTGQWARRTVIGQYVHGYGCPPDGTLCATCKTPVGEDHKINKIGAVVHAHGCPKKTRPNQQ